MRSLTLALTAAALLANSAIAQAAPRSDGLIIVGSSHTVSVTMERLEAAVSERGLNVFARVDHAANARGADLELRPTQLLLFGNPRIGTRLMRCRRSVAIDLPQKFLVWADDGGSVWIGYNDPAHLAERHGLGECGEDVVTRVSGALAGIAETAASAGD